MVQGKFKSGRFRKQKVKVPGGRTVTRYLERKPKQPRCAVTGKALHGIPRMSATKAKNAPKTIKRPERPYGGVLSSRAMRVKMEEEARIMSEGSSGASALYAVGTLCLKIAGRDAGKRCVIVDEKNGKFLVDGETRRRLVNPAHLEPLGKEAKIKKGAAHAEIEKVFKDLGITPRATTPKKVGERPRKKRSVKRKGSFVKEQAKPAIEKIDADKTEKPSVKSQQSETKDVGGAKEGAEAGSETPSSPKKTPKAEKKVSK